MMRDPMMSRLANTVNHRPASRPAARSPASNTMARSAGGRLPGWLVSVAF